MDMFLHRMALELHMPVAELEIRMPASELLDWLEYWERVNKPEAEYEGVEITSPEQLEALFG